MLLIYFARNLFFPFFLFINYFILILNVFGSFFLLFCLGSNVVKPFDINLLSSGINQRISGQQRAERWNILQRDSLGCPLPGSVLIVSLWGRVGRAVGLRWLRVHIQWPWAPACNTHTRAQTHTLEPLWSGRVRTLLTWVCWGPVGHWCGGGGAYKPSSLTDGWGTLRLLGTGATDD